MSDPFVGPVSATGSPAPVRETSPGMPVAPVRGVGEESFSSGAPNGAEFDRMELRSTGREAYAVFTVHRKTSIVSIKIVDARTDEVIREIPTEELLHVAEQAQAYLEARRSRHNRR